MNARVVSSICVLQCVAVVVNAHVLQSICALQCVALVVAVVVADLVAVVVAGNMKSLLYYLNGMHARMLYVSMCVAVSVAVNMPSALFLKGIDAV